MGIHILRSRIPKTVLSAVAGGVVWGVLSFSFASAAPTDLVIVAAKGFPADSLTIEDVQNIYLGKKRTVGTTPVVAIDQSDTEHIKLEFLNRVLHLTHAEYRAQLLKRRFQEGAVTPKFEPNSAEVLRNVATTPGAVGYVYESELGSFPGLKVLAVVPTE